MKLIVFGATGGTGQQVVAQALAQGHAVTAFVRRSEAVTTQHMNLTVQEKIIMADGSDWIIARPGGLTDGPLTGTYRVTGPSDKVGRPAISRADVADFMLKNLMNGRYVRKAVGLTY